MLQHKRKVFRNFYEFSFSNVIVDCVKFIFDSHNHSKLDIINQCRKYSGDSKSEPLNEHHLNTERFIVRIWDGSIFERSGIQNSNGGLNSKPFTN